MPHHLFVFMVGDPINGKCHCKNNECRDNYICNMGSLGLMGDGSLGSARDSVNYLKIESFS